MEKMEWKKSDISDLLPWEFRERLAAKPVAYLPLGMLAWRGEHLPLGSDAIQSEVLQGMDYADSTDPHRQLDGRCFRLRPYWQGPPRPIPPPSPVTIATRSFERLGISFRPGRLTIRNTASLYSSYCKL